MNKKKAREKYLLVRREIVKDTSQAQKTSAQICTRVSLILASLAKYLAEEQDPASTLKRTPSPVTPLILAPEKVAKLQKAIFKRISSTNSISKSCEKIELGKKEKFFNDSLLLKTMLYHPLTGEWDLLALLTNPLLQCYLPRITNELTKKMLAAPAYLPLKKNSHLKMFEPTNSNGEINAMQLHAVILPGLAFSLSGTRLGFGGGYYDRFLQSSYTEEVASATVASKETSSAKKHIHKPLSMPLRIGVFSSIQQIEELTSNKTDVPLHLAVTEKNIFFFKPFHFNATP